MSIRLITPAPNRISWSRMLLRESMVGGQRLVNGQLGWNGMFLELNVLTASASIYKSAVFPPDSPALYFHSTSLLLIPNSSDFSLISHNAFHLSPRPIPSCRVRHTLWPLHGCPGGQSDRRLFGWRHLRLHYRLHRPWWLTHQRWLSLRWWFHYVLLDWEGPILPE